MMKWLNFNFLTMKMIALAFVFVMGSCGDDDEPAPTPGGGTDEEVSLDALNALITEAETALNGAEEGFDLGNYRIGSIALLTGVVDNAKTLVGSDPTDAAVVTNAENTLKSALDTFMASVVSSVANPWIQQVANNRILLTDSDAGTSRGLLSVIDAGKSFTIEMEVFFVSLERLGFSQSLISAAKQFNSDGSASVNDGFHIRAFETGSIEFINGNSNPGAWQETGRSADGLFTAGQWHHIAYAHDGPDRILYVDGQEIFKEAYEYNSIAENTAVEGISIGNSFDWTDRVMNGLVRDIRIWNTAIPAADLNKDGLTGTGDGLEAWFPLASDQGSSFVDVSGNYQAVLGDLVPWAPNGDPNQVQVDYSALEAAVSSAQTFLAGVTEGSNAGDIGVGTIEWFTPIVDAAAAGINDMVDGATVQNLLGQVETGLERAENNLVVGGAANGFTNDVDGNAAMRVFPNWNPEGSSFTAEVYFTPSQLGGDIFGNGDFGFRYKENDADFDSVRFFHFADGAFNDIFAPFSLELGTEYHLALVYDADTQDQILYINKEEIGRLENIGATGIVGFGETWVGATFGFSKGAFRDFRVWREAKAAADLDADVADPTTEANLQMYLPFDFKAAPLTKDGTGNHFVEQIGAIDWIN